MFLFQCVEANPKPEGTLDQQKQRNLNDVSVQVNLLDKTEQVTDSLENALNIQVNLFLCLL